MADVFISYCRADQPTAEALAQDLKASGLTVWWDAALQAGSRFHREIHGELQSARHVIVLWSEQTIASQYVEAEAEEARILGKLIPARLDGSTLPMLIRNTLQIADLRDWESGLVSILRTLGVEISDPDEAPRSFAAHDPPEESTDEGRIWRELIKAKLVLLRHYESFGAFEYAKLRRTLRRQCAEFGHLESMHRSAEDYWQGLDGDQNHRLAFEILSEAHVRGVMASTALLGHMYEQGEGTRINLRKARECYEAAAKNSNDYALWSLARMHLSGRGAPRDPQRAKRLLDQAAHAGNGIAYAEIGKMHEAGLAVPRDLSAAIQCYQLSLEAGFQWAGFRLGQMALEGIGQPADAALARHFFEIGSAADFQWSLYSLADLLQRGVGGPIDLEAARRSFERAHHLGNRWATVALALMIRDGEGGSGNRPLWLQLLEKAASDGNVGAMMELGRAYESGEHIESSLTLSRKYYDCKRRSKNPSVRQPSRSVAPE